MKHTTLLVKNMYGRCCFRIVELVLKQIDVRPHKISGGRIVFSYNPAEIPLEKIEVTIENEGFEIIKSREQRLVEEAKQAIYELIYEMNNADSVVRKSEYLVEKINLSYQQISKIFSKQEGITLEKYFIRHKIERIKQLINSQEYTLSEIAYMMDYSSVQYLSNQFKKETGASVSEYKNNPQLFHVPFDELY